MGHMGNECPLYRGLVDRGQVPAFVPKEAVLAEAEGIDGTGTHADGQGAQDPSPGGGEAGDPDWGA